VVESHALIQTSVRKSNRGEGESGGCGEGRDHLGGEHTGTLVPDHHCLGYDVVVCVCDREEYVQVTERACVWM